PPRVRVGNLAARRDFSDVRDIVRGYRLLAERGAPGEVYQLCSGRATSIETVLRLLLGFTAKPVAIAVDRGKWRAADIPVLRGSNRRAVEELGFANRYSLKQTLRETFAYWKERLSAENE
ncbi:MAG TPA: GDP-mannose 4,6-dehydratase, partial [candidate division Zixibacteria bacterium]|nr:GDP-mannose 4,6-dehydratase [candidate division Zixibacteria bacterium]